MDASHGNSPSMSLGAATLVPNCLPVASVAMKTEKTKESFQLEQFTNLRKTYKELQRISIKSQLRINWKKFCDNTKLAGLHLIGGYRKGSVRMRLLLLLVWLMGLGCSLYKCWYCFELYLNRGVQTTITYDSMNKMEFPAITFCHIVGFRKSIVGMNEDLVSLLSHLMVRKQEELPVVENQNKRICVWNNQSTPQQIHMAQDMKYRIINLVLRADSEPFYKLISVDSTSSVNKCWWNNRETNCSQIFLNHQIENNICFTFNQNPTYIDSNKGSIGVAIYGMDTNHYKEKTVDSYGPSSSLKLLLNVHQEEYCVSLLERFGAGFNVFVHDTRSQSTFNIDSSISLSPGYDHTITLRPVLHDRRNFTESLKNCVSYVYNFMKPNLTDYNQESCFAACLAKSIFGKCKCLAVHKSSPLINVNTAQYLGISKINLKSCNLLVDEQRDCFAEHLVYYLSQNPETFCPLCKRSCLETEYEFDLTAKKLSRLQIAAINIDNQYTNASEEFIEKNSLFVSFMFHDKNLITIREIQAFTPLNFYMAIGSILSLFLGFSTISLYEVVHYLLLSISILINRYMRLKKIKRKSKVTPVLFAALISHSRIKRNEM